MWVKAVTDCAFWMLHNGIIFITFLVYIHFLEKKVMRLTFCVCVCVLSTFEPVDQFS